MLDSNLSAFCSAILESLKKSQRGETAPHWFLSDVGLCTNAYRYDLRFGTNVYTQIEHLFNGEEYPFNKGAFGSYAWECRKDIIYENKERIAFLELYAARQF